MKVLKDLKESKDVKFILKGFFRFMLILIIPFVSGWLVGLNATANEYFELAQKNAASGSMCVFYNYWNAGLQSLFCLILIAGICSTFVLALWYLGGGREDNRW